MADNPALEMLDMMIGMEAQMVVLRQMLVFLTADRFSLADNPDQLLEATSDFMSRAMAAKEADGASVR